jgi:hypothetical protein
MSTYLDQLNRRWRFIPIAPFTAQKTPIVFTSEGQVWNSSGPPDNDCIHCSKADGGRKTVLVLTRTWRAGRCAAHRLLAAFGLAS